VRVEAECPRPRKSRSARCRVSTDLRFSSAFDREPCSDLRPLAGAGDVPHSPT